MAHIVNQITAPLVIEADGQRQFTKVGHLLVCIECLRTCAHEHQPVVALGTTHPRLPVEESLGIAGFDNLLATHAVERTAAASCQPGIAAAVEGDTQDEPADDVRVLLGKVLLVGLFMGVGTSVFAQKTVSGTVVDENGEPVIGAAVMVVEDATKGTVVDENGRYSITVNQGQTLRVSSIGFKTQDVKVGSSGTANITLETDINLLDNAVAIGYGTARKGDLTGSISSVRGETVSERSQTMLSTALQGQIAGLQVTRSSGEPGAQGTIRIHGVTTMSTNDPLVIVDGVPGSINDVIAEDVQDIAVLKDAAAASIYGSRAAAGVILITTKRAQENKFSVDYNYFYAIDKPTARPKLTNATDWMRIVDDLKYNDGASSPFSEYTEADSISCPSVYFGVAESLSSGCILSL